MKFLNKLKNTDFYKNWVQAFAVCYPMMVQGDLSCFDLYTFLEGKYYRLNCS